MCPVASTQGTCASSRTAFWSEFLSFQPRLEQAKGVGNGASSTSEDSEDNGEGHRQFPSCESRLPKHRGKEMEAHWRRVEGKEVHTSGAMEGPVCWMFQTVLRWSGTSLHAVILDIITAPSILSLVPSQIMKSEAAVDMVRSEALVDGGNKNEITTGERGYHGQERVNSTTMMAPDLPITSCGSPHPAKRWLPEGTRLNRSQC